jgi:deoxyribose-phosphate aldolase
MYEQLKGTGILIGFPFDYPMGIPGFAGFKSNVTRAAMAADAYEHGCRTADIYPNISAFANKDYKAVVESIKVILDNVGPDFESKIFVDCSGDIDDMYAMVDCIQEAGATHAKAYDKNKYGVPITRIKALRERLTSAGLKASGNGKHWHTLITMGVLAAGADFISATNVPQIVDELPIFEDIFSNVTF